MAKPFSDCGEELLVTIFQRLSSRETAMCAKVCTLWRSAANTLNSSYYWFRTAMSECPRLEDAVEEVLQDVQSEPFWPNFAIVFAGVTVDLPRVTEILRTRLPESLSLIACNTTGVTGKNVNTGLFDEEQTHVTPILAARWTPNHISLSVGRFPGFTVKALRLKVGYFSVDNAHKFPFGPYHGSMTDVQVARFVDAARGLQAQPPMCMLVLAHPELQTVVVQKLVKSLELAFGGDSTISLVFPASSRRKQGFVVHSLSSRPPTYPTDAASSSSSRMHMDNRRIPGLRTTRGTSTLSRISSRRHPYLEDHFSDIADTRCAVAALAFSDDCGYQRLTERKLKCAVLAAGVLPQEHLIPKGPVYKLNNIYEFFDPRCRRMCILFSCMQLQGEEYVSVSTANIFSTWGVLTHVTREDSETRAGGDQRTHVDYMRCERVGPNEDDLRIRIDGCTKLRLGTRFQFHTPSPSCVIGSMDRLLSSFARANPNANIVGALQFSTADYHAYKDAVCENRNLFREYFPDAPMAGATSHEQYGPATFITAGERGRRSSPNRIVCYNKRDQGLFCSSMFFIFFSTSGT